MPVPYVAAAQALLGAGQMLFSGQKKEQKKLEGLANSYTPNASILDYYDKALAKYDPNAYNSASYREGKTRIGSNLATGISATQDRRSGVGSIGSLVAGADRASLSNIANAEQINSAALGRLGQATGMKAAEDKYKFELGYNLQAKKAAAAAEKFNAGISNIGGAISSVGQMSMLDKIYGGGDSGEKVRSSTTATTPGVANPWFNSNNRKTKPLWQIGWKKS